MPPASTDLSPIALLKTFFQSGTPQWWEKKKVSDLEKMRIFAVALFSAIASQKTGTQADMA